jgi:AtzE family amidohydrolase
MSKSLFFKSALEISELVKNGQLSATEVVNCFLKRIEMLNPQLNAYTEVTHARALKSATKVDKLIAEGKSTGPLTGVPFSVKNLYDIEGLVTLAGSKINRDNPPANKDAILIQRLESAGAILLGALNMGEYAYDFTGENSHDGNCHNPWNINNMTGGSSSGSGSATAAGMAPISLGSDTNGSIRVPASLCGIFGLKPTYGRLPRTGSYPFCDSLDHLGPLARNVTDLATAFDVIQGFDAADHACANQPTLNTVKELSKGIEGLRIVRANGYFATTHFPEATTAINQVCDLLNCHQEITIPAANEGRSAAFLITNAEGSALHLSRLQARAEDFDPDTRYRFLAGTMIPATWYLRAQKVRHWYHKQALELFKSVDIIIAPATPCTAPQIGQKTLIINGKEQALRPNLGYFTQPISAIGFPSCVVPTINPTNGMPIGVQIIAAPWKEDFCLRVASYLESKGLTALEPKGLC